MQRLVALAAMLLLLAGCRPMANYEDAAMPRFAGTHARGGMEFNGTVDVVTWNIRFGEHVEAAIAELKQTPALQDADILLLQEMDETGVWTIARTLAYDYVYFPASVHPQNGSNFGNAVLSKWSILDARKIVLPHRNPRNGQMRIAVYAQVDIDGRTVDVYSVHIETPWLGPSQRADQVETTIAPIAAQVQHVIVGGDFNTLTEQGVEGITAIMAQAQLNPASDATQATMRVAGVGITPDHIFARGFHLVDTGVAPASDASDHLPLWSNLRFDETE